MSNPNGSHWIRTPKRLRIYTRDGWRCQWCSCRVVRTRTRRPLSYDATLDHFLPRALGGGNETTNVFTACYRCNSSRGDAAAIAYAFATGRVEALDRIIDAIARPLPVGMGPCP